MSVAAKGANERLTMIAASHVRGGVIRNAWRSGAMANGAANST